MTEAPPDLFAETVDQRTAIVGVLRGLATEDWDRPSLCEGWRIREAVAHIELPFRYPTLRFLWELAKSRGRFNAMADRVARRDAATYPPQELLAFLEANTAHRWRPPVGGQLGALSHDVIHGLDVTQALGLTTVSPPERIGLVLGSPQLAGAFGVDLDGVRLRATDIEYAVGTGREVALPAKDVLLVLTGREPVPTGG